MKYLLGRLFQNNAEIKIYKYHVSFYGSHSDGTVPGFGKNDAAIFYGISKAQVQNEILKNKTYTGHIVSLINCIRND